MTQGQTDYIRRNNDHQVQYSPSSQAGQPKPAVLFKRIGSTTYRVNVHFSETSKEDMSDKILRLIRNDKEAVG